MYHDVRAIAIALYAITIARHIVERDLCQCKNGSHSLTASFMHCVKKKILNASRMSSLTASRWSGAVTYVVGSSGRKNLTTWIENSQLLSQQFITEFVNGQG